MYPFPRFPLWAVCRSVKAYPLLMCFCRPTKPYCSLIKKARKITAVQYNRQTNTYRLYRAEQRVRQDSFSHRESRARNTALQNSQTEGRELFQIFHHVQYILSVFKVGCWLRETIWREIAFIVGPIPGMVGVGHSLDLLFFLPE